MVFTILKASWICIEIFSFVKLKNAAKQVLLRMIRKSFRFDQHISILCDVVAVPIGCIFSHQDEIGFDKLCQKEGNDNPSLTSFSINISISFPHFFFYKCICQTILDRSYLGQLILLADWKIIKTRNCYIKWIEMFCYSLRS